MQFKYCERSDILAKGEILIDSSVVVILYSIN